METEILFASISRHSTVSFLFLKRRPLEFLPKGLLLLNTSELSNKSFINDRKWSRTLVSHKGTK